MLTRSSHVLFRGTRPTQAEQKLLVTPEWQHGLIQVRRRKYRAFNQSFHLKTCLDVFTRVAHVYDGCPIGNLKYLQMYGYRLITSQYRIVSSFYTILWCRRKASVRPPYRASQVCRGLCLTMGCVINSGFCSTIFAASDLHFLIILTVYPAAVICLIRDMVLS